MRFVVLLCESRGLSISCIVHDNSLLIHIQFLEGMSQKIVKGIEEAQSDLSKEKQKKDEEVRVPSLPVPLLSSSLSPCSKGSCTVFQWWALFGVGLPLPPPPHQKEDHLTLHKVQ